MLTLLPNCECCDRDLPPESDQARICTYECTFCADCAEERFHGICPNCGGDLVRRPIRPPEKLLKDPAVDAAVIGMQKLADVLDQVRRDCSDRSETL